MQINLFFSDVCKLRPYSPALSVSVFGFETAAYLQQPMQSAHLTLQITYQIRHYSSVCLSNYKRGCENNECN